MCKNHEPMKITTPAISLFAAITFNSCATQAPQPANFGCRGTDTPDHQLRACVVEVGKFPPPLNESRVDIHDTSGKVLASRNFGSPKGDQGRSVVHSAWTPDSNFFVFSTRSSGGHSPWHGNTYFYSRKTNKFALLDDTDWPSDQAEFQRPSTRRRAGHCSGHCIRSDRHQNGARRQQAPRHAVGAQSLPRTCMPVRLVRQDA